MKTKNKNENSRRSNSVMSVNIHHRTNEFICKMIAMIYFKIKFAFSSHVTFDNFFPATTDDTPKDASIAWN